MSLTPEQAFTRKERLEFLHRCHQHLDEQVRYSNQKASYILTTVGAIFVGCGAALLGPKIDNATDIALLISGLGPMRGGQRGVLRGHLPHHPAPTRPHDAFAHVLWQHRGDVRP